MFAQIVQGRVTDPAGLQKQWERWIEDVKPGAEGFLGSTGGVTANGEFVTIARFESEDAARANSNRPEQSAWWEETSQYLDNPMFHDCRQVDVFGGGGSDEAGFVQVIQGKVTDVEASRALDARMEPELRERRPDVIGGVNAWHPENGRFTTFLYFTSEADARVGEKKMENDPNAAEFMREMQALSDGEPKFLDLTEPWMT